MKDVLKRLLAGEFENHFSGSMAKTKLHYGNI